MSEAFVKRALELASKTGSRIVLALDPIFNPYRFRRISYRSRERFEVTEGAKKLLLELRGFVPGVKLGLPIMVGLGPDEVESIVSLNRRRYFFIFDLKMADIGHINRLVAEQLFWLGFDAVIVHAAIGSEEGIDRVVKLAEEMGRGVLAVCAMSHPGAGEHLNRNFAKLLSIAASAGVDGFVLPATRPRLITRARRAYPSKLIFSPGVGIQGGRFGSALSAGADFEIVGRSIAQAPSPTRRVREILKEMGG